MTLSTRGSAAILVLTLSTLLALPAAAGGDLRQLFPRTAAIELDGSGLYRLDLPESVLAACASRKTLMGSPPSSTILICSRICLR